MVSLAVRKIEYFILSIGKWDKDKSGCMVSLAVLLKPSFFLAYSYRYYVTNRIVLSLPRMLLANHLIMSSIVTSGLLVGLELSLHLCDLVFSFRKN